MNSAEEFWLIKVTIRHFSMAVVDIFDLVDMVDILDTVDRGNKDGHRHYEFVKDFVYQSKVFA